MNLRELIGRNAIRTVPIILDNGSAIDYSYCRSMITVIDVIDDIPIVRDGNFIKEINIPYDDDNWKDVTKAYEYINNANNSLKVNADNKNNTIKIKDIINKLEGSIEYVILETMSGYISKHITELKEFEKELEFDTFEVSVFKNKSCITFKMHDCIMEEE